MKNDHLNISKELIKLAAPVALFNSTTVLSTLIIGFFFAKLGPSTLAAGALISVAQTTMMMIFSAPLFVVSSIISRMHAEERNLEIGKLMQQSYLLSLMLAIPVIMCMLLIKIIFSQFRQEQEIILLSGLYFDSYLWGVPASMLLTCLQQFLLGIKKTYFLTVIGVASLIFTFFFSYSLAFGAFNIPQMGVSGLGIAQSIRSWFLLLLSFFYVYMHKDFVIFKLKDISSFGKLNFLNQIVRLGWPISIHATSEFIALFVIGMIVGGIGFSGLTAQHISTQYILMLSTLFIGLSQSCNLLVSRSIGNQCHNKIESYGYMGIALSFVIGVTAVVISSIFPDTFIGLYIDLNQKSNLEIFHIIKPFFVIMMLWQLFEGVKGTCTGALRALYDTKTPMIYSFIGKWCLAVPIAYFTTYKFNWGISAIGGAHLIGSGICSLLLFERWRVLSFNISFPQNQPKVIFYRLWNKKRDVQQPNVIQRNEESR